MKVLRNHLLGRSGRLATWALASLLSTGYAAEALAISMEQIISLLDVEATDDQIIKRIQKDGSKFNLTPKEIMELKRKGATDKLIRFMLSTGAGTAPKAAEAAPKKPVERELTDAERAAEEAKLREESIRLAEEQKRREEAQRAAFAGKVLRQGQDYANAGQFVPAIQVFTKFVEDGVGGMPFAPDSNEAYIAKYGMANALARAGLIQSAADTLLDVVALGSDKMFFQTAFSQLRDLRKQIIYRPPELEKLTGLSVDRFDAGFQDSFYYMLGESLKDYIGSDRARAYLEKVSSTSKDYARAQYLLGLMEIPDNPDDKLTGAQVKAASESFQRAVEAAEAHADMRPVVDLAYLALARLAYDIQQFDAAIFYYKKISKNSPKLATAFYESGWTYFLKGDTSRALGTFHALHSPYFAHHFYPELWVLEATAYVNMCLPDRAEAAMKMFEDKVMVLGPPLRDFLKRPRKNGEYYAQFVAAVNNPKSAQGLPRQLQSPVLMNVEFFNLHNTIKQIQKEEQIITAKLGELGPFGQEVLSKLGQRRKDLEFESSTLIQQTLRQAQRELELYQDKLAQLRLDLDEIRVGELDKELAGEAAAAGEAVAKEGPVAIAGSDSMSWPFQGEFWKDEIGAYRSFLKSKCNRRYR
jgi:tetratricopeptide (TPR) repeat protein